MLGRENGRGGKGRKKRIKSDCDIGLVQHAVMFAFYRFRGVLEKKWNSLARTVEFVRMLSGGARASLLRSDPIWTFQQGMTAVFRRSGWLFLAGVTFVEAVKHFGSEKHTEKLCQHSLHVCPHPPTYRFVSFQKYCSEGGCILEKAKATKLGHPHMKG